MTAGPALRGYTDEALLAEARARSFLRPNVRYPGWTFGAGWDDPSPAFEARRAIWEEFQRRRLETPVEFAWLDGIRLELYLGNDLSRQLYVAGCADPNEFALLDTLLQPGMVLVDAGANVGLYSLFAARRVGDGGAVLAFEPSSREFARLQRNLALNGLRNVRAFAVALSDEDGEAALQVAGSNHEGVNTLGAFVHEGIELAGVERVRTRRLDDVIAEGGISRLDFLKIDVEGGEVRVLRGAQSALQRFRPIIVVEVLDAALQAQGSSGAELVQLLRSMNYLLYTFDESGRPVPAGDGETSVNMIAAPVERALPEVARAEQRQEQTIPLSPEGAPTVTSFRPGLAYWNQRHMLAQQRERILALSRAVDLPTDCHPYQFAQLLAAAADFEPDLIIELGRGRGNSTCAFTQASAQKGGAIRVVSLCQSQDWRTITAPRLRGVVPAEWHAPLRALEGDILAFDYRELLADAKRVLLFWDAHGFAVAECVLGEILPLIAPLPHVVLMHDLSDTRYGGPEQMSYGGQRLWKGNDWSGQRLKLGIIDSAVEQSVAALDFTTRNRLTLDSADHSIHTDLTPEQQAEMKSLLGDLFETQAHWFYFTLNEQPGPYHFPRFEKASEPVTQPKKRWWSR